AGYAAAGYAGAGPYGGEPLGFSGSHFDPGPGYGTPPISGIFSAPEEEFLEEPVCADGPAPAVSSGEWLRGGCWYTQQSVVYMSRSSNVKNSIDLGIDFSSAPVGFEHFRNVLRIPVGMGFQPGWRGTIGRYLGRDDRNRDHSVEFTFLGLTHW